MATHLWTVRLPGEVGKCTDLPLGLESRLSPRGPAILPEFLHLYKAKKSVISNGLEAYLMIMKGLQVLEDKGIT